MEWYYINNIFESSTKNGDSFKTLSLTGSNGMITANMFNSAKGCPIKGTISEIDLTQGKYNNITVVGKSLSIKEFELEHANHELLKAGFKDKYELADLLCLIETVAATEDNNLTDFIRSKTCFEMLSDMQGYPAALKYHHVKYNGLLSHTFEVASMYWTLANANMLNLEFVLEGFIACLFHDYGKIYEYCDKPNWLIGHVCNSTMLLTTVLEKHGLSEKQIEIIQHCMLAHHGKKEWGSPVEPKIPEAVLLHHCDCLSASCYQS